MLNPQFIARLIKAAQRTTWSDQCQNNGDVIDDFAGGNVDDAYDGGQRDGETELAQEILGELGIEY